MKKGITIRILGDFGPFSKMGKSIGYEITIGQSIFLLDCGAPLFQQVGGNRLQHVKGLIITHCHDDHKRWFSDLALFHRYEPKVDFKIFLLTAEDIYSEILKASQPALDRSLSMDSKTIVDIPKEDYVHYKMIGPRARYTLTSKDEGNGITRQCIVDLDGNEVGPETAKVVISRKTRRPRILFKDPHHNEWVEPESFYPFSSNVFYEDDRNIYQPAEGITLEALKAPVWHGLPSIGIKITTAQESLVFSSDTMHDVHLWKELYTEKRPQRLSMSKKEFDAASVLYGDINDYIERIWSEDRYTEALNTFKNSVVIHDISYRNSVVHTDYEKLGNTCLSKEKSILTHSPDRITSEWVLCHTDKTFEISGDRFYELVEGKRYPMNGAIYHRDNEKFYVGYKNENGRYTVYEKDGLLHFSSTGNYNGGKPLYRVDLYEDLAGKYFPVLEDENAYYRKRRDGKIELVELSEEGSRGRIVENHRDRLEGTTEYLKHAVPETEERPVHENSR